METSYQYPPDLFQLLVDTIPVLCRSKTDVLDFFRGAGVRHRDVGDLAEKVRTDRQGIRKHEMVRTVLTRLNERGDDALRERREILKRVAEFEDFSTCWDDERLKAQGLVAQIGRLINVKDAFTRMNQERERERQQRVETHRRKMQQLQEREERYEALKKEFYRLFAETNPQRRGKMLEGALKAFFNHFGILVREDFHLCGDSGEGIVEQIDGVIEFDAHLYLVEMKWLSKSVDKPDMSNHLVGVYHRGYTRGIFITATDYTSAAVALCCEALQMSATA